MDELPHIHSSQGKLYCTYPGAVPQWVGDYTELDASSPDNYPDTLEGTCRLEQVSPTFLSDYMDLFNVTTDAGDALPEYIIEMGPEGEREPRILRQVKFWSLPVGPDSSPQVLDFTAAWVSTSQASHRYVQGLTND